MLHVCFPEMFSIDLEPETRKFGVFSHFFESAREEEFIFLKTRQWPACVPLCLGSSEFCLKAF